MTTSLNEGFLFYFLLYENMRKIVYISVYCGLFLVNIPMSKTGQFYEGTIKLKVVLKVFSIIFYLFLRIKKGEKIRVSKMEFGMKKKQKTFYF